MILKRKDTHGKIRYGVRVYKDGGTHWLGTFGKLGEARAAERDALASKQETGVTCGTFARNWLSQDCPRTSGRQLKSETVKEYHYRLKRFIEEFEKASLADVQRSEAFDWALSNRHDVPFVAALFSHAHDLGLIAANPFAALGLSKGKGRKHDHPLTKAQVYELADAVYEVENPSPQWKLYAPTFRAFILFQAFTAMRPGEAFELRWSDIKGDRITVERRRGKFGTVDLPKSNKPRDIVFPPPAREALQTFPRGIDYVFRGVQGQPIKRGSLFRYFKKTREAAGMSHIVPYHLRHFCGWYLYVEMDLPARVVAEQLGHDDGGALVQKLYGHGNVGALEQLEEAWANVG